MAIGAATYDVNAQAIHPTFENRVLLTMQYPALSLSDGDSFGRSSIEKFGFSDAIQNSDITTVWDGADISGREIYVYPSSAINVKAVSNDTANDNSTGTGARTIEVQGLDSSYNQITETITVGGAASSSQFLRIFRARVATAGSKETNAGTISIQEDGTSDTYAQINEVGSSGLGNGQTFMCVYTVPAGKTAYLSQWAVSTSKSNDTVAFFSVKPFSNTAWNAKDVANVSSGNYIKNYITPLKFEEKTDIEVRAYSSNTGVTLSSSFNIILLDNQ